MSGRDWGGPLPVEGDRVHRLLLGADLIADLGEMLRDVVDQTVHDDAGIKNRMIFIYFSPYTIERLINNSFILGVETAGGQIGDDVAITVPKAGHEDGVAIVVNQTVHEDAGIQISFLVLVFIFRVNDYVYL